MDGQSQGLKQGRYKRQKLCFLSTGTFECKVIPATCDDNPHKAEQNEEGITDGLVTGEDSDGLKRVKEFKRREHDTAPIAPPHRPISRSKEEPRTRMALE